MLWVSVLLVALLTTFTHGARILAVMSIPSFSHQIVYRPLWRELSLRGHEVTLLTSDPMKDPTLINLTEVDMSATYTLTSKATTGTHMNDANNFNRFELYNFIIWWGNIVADTELKLPKVQEIINNKTEHFDLVIAEFHIPQMYAFAKRFNCPLISVSTFDTLSRVYNAIGNPHHPLVNSECLSYTEEISTIYHRFLSVAYTLYIKYLSHYIHTDEQNKLVEKYFGPGYPSVTDLERSISLMFINTDIVMHSIHPLLPTVVPIGGGIHIKPSKPLPKDLQKQCDDAKQGFIYFSLGTNVKSHLLPKGTIKMLLELFSELPYTVFWKFETDELPSKPKNLVISKWFPQQSFLEHPNAKLFITQGGLQSLHEAILNKVPIIGIPFIGDQPKNVEKIVQKEMGLQLNSKTMTKTQLKQAILEVIENPKYKNNAEKYGELLRDQPMSGIEKAVWWTEHVLRHNGTAHLRSPAADIPLYQYFFLDVIGLSMAVVSLVSIVVVLVSKLLIRIVKAILYSKPKTE